MVNEREVCELILITLLGTGCVVPQYHSHVIHWLVSSECDSIALNVMVHPHILLNI